MPPHALLAAVRADLRPLTAVGDAVSLREFCAALADGRAGEELPLDPAHLLHPAGPPCVGAMVGETLAGIAWLDARPRDAGARLGVVVRVPWRRAGLGARLTRAVLHDRGAAELRWAAMTVARSNRAALALGRACGMDRVELDEDHVVLRAPLGRPALRCA